MFKGHRESEIRRLNRHYQSSGGKTPEPPYDVLYTSDWMRYVNTFSTSNGINIPINNRQNFTDEYGNNWRYGWIDYNFYSDYASSANTYSSTFRNNVISQYTFDTVISGIALNIPYRIYGKIATMYNNDTEEQQPRQYYSDTARNIATGVPQMPETYGTSINRVDSASLWEGWSINGYSPFPEYTVYSLDGNSMLYGNGEAYYNDVSCFQIRTVMSQDTNNFFYHRGLAFYPPRGTINSNTLTMTTMSEPTSASINALRATETITELNRLNTTPNIAGSLTTTTLNPIIVSGNYQEVPIHMEKVYFGDINFSVKTVGAQCFIGYIGFYSNRIPT